MPVDFLMQEHRIIERMIPPIKNELSKIKETKEVNPEFIDITIDFIRTYADHCHHGKEEGILFRELAKKKLAGEHDTIMKELINEHVYARTATSNLEKAKDNYVNGNTEARNDVWKFLNDLAEFYPKHIKKEDKKSSFHQWNTLHRANKRPCYKNSGTSTENSSTKNTRKQYPKWKTCSNTERDLSRPQNVAEPNRQFQCLILIKFSVVRGSKGTLRKL